MKRFLLPICLVFCLLGCDEGTPLDNLAPETKISVERINLTGPDRLNSLVRLFWSGDDQDGYIKGYELSFDETVWTFTSNTDSTFQFDLQAGSDSSDIDFFVRAIDNEDLADPSPAFLRIPIKNTPPEAIFDTINLIPDTVFSAWSTTWSLQDLDGNETIDSAFIRLNDGEWFAFGPNISFGTFVASMPETDGLQGADIYLGTAAELQSVLLGSLAVGAPNRMYIRVRDIAGSMSEIDSTKSFFVRRKTGDLLLVDDLAVNSADEFYHLALGGFVPSYVFIDIITFLPPFWDPSFGLFFN
ncbi:MAG: hypothetical protein AAF206_28625, partial [Bacteroidota bacterium]